MSLLFYLKLYLLTIPVFFILDILWLGVVARGFYQRMIGHLLSANVNWGAAVFFYLIYIAGILFFAVRPAINSGSWPQAIYSGALFGFFTYATYDLTNLATLKEWPIKLVTVDIVWGSCLCALVAGIAYLIAGRLSAG